MASANTVIGLKESFLRNQVRLLSQDLQPSRNWRNRAPVPEQGDLSEKVVQDVLEKGEITHSLHALSVNSDHGWQRRTVNTIARHHKRAVYSSQALRHVAEQIDALYWAAAEPDGDEEAEGTDALEKGSDFTSDE